VSLVPVPIKAPATNPTPTADSQWIELVQPAADLANMIAATEFVPQEMRNRPAAITAAILYGAEIGIGPMQALAKVDIVKGRPAPRAELARALALAAGHDLWVEESTNTRVTVAGRRRNSQNVQKVTWTMDDARKAGIANNPTYAKYPRQMLLARASAELVRQMCPEVLGGITVFAEEATDIDSDTPELAPAAKPEPTTRRRRTPAPAEPAPTEQPDLDDIADVQAEKPTAAQTKKAMALFTENGLDDRDDRIHATSAAIGRNITSWNDVTKTEAARVIDTLEQLQHGTAGINIDDTGNWAITVNTDDDPTLPLLPDEDPL
jgi:hypothetical protein